MNFPADTIERRLFDEAARKFAVTLVEARVPEPPELLAVIKGTATTTATGGRMGRSP